MKKILALFGLSIFWMVSVAFAYTVSSGTFNPSKTEIASLKRTITAMKKKEKTKPGYSAWYISELQKAMTVTDPVVNAGSSSKKEVIQKAEKPKEPIYLNRAEKKTAETSTSTSSSSSSSYTSGSIYYTGPKGGCYYINSKGNKTYVDRGFCG